MRGTLGRDGKPVKIMASIGGSRARHDKSTWPEWDPVDTVEMGNRAARGRAGGEELQLLRVPDPFQRTSPPKFLGWSRFL